MPVVVPESTVVGGCPPLSGVVHRCRGLSYQNSTNGALCCVKHARPVHFVEGDILTLTHRTPVGVGGFTRIWLVFRRNVTYLRVPEGSWWACFHLPVVGGCPPLSGVVGGLQEQQVPARVAVREGAHLESNILQCEASWIMVPSLCRSRAVGHSSCSAHCREPWWALSQQLLYKLRGSVVVSMCAGSYVDGQSLCC